MERREVDQCLSDLHFVCNRVLLLIKITVEVVNNIQKFSDTMKGLSRMEESLKAALELRRDGYLVESNRLLDELISQHPEHAMLHL